MSRRQNFLERCYSSQDPKQLICQLCADFYELGWVTGSGGGMSIKVGERVFVAPSGVQKEDLIADDVFTLSSQDKNIVLEPPRTPNLKQSACTPLWYEVFKHRPEAKSVIHTHSMNAQLCTLLNGDEDKVFRITHFEMLKGVGNHGYEDELVVPIIDNRPTEDLLAEQLGEAVRNYPKANAVLVRRHGLYVWGNSWQDAKIHAECYDYLFETALKAKAMGIDFTARPKSGTYRVSSLQPLKRLREESVFEGREEAAFSVARVIPSANGHKHGRTTVFLFDIEGTTTPISFVKDVLFPYAADHVNEFLESSWESSATKDDVSKLLEQSRIDQNEGLQSAPILKEGVLKSTFIKDLEAYVRWCIAEDRKISALKQLQGHMWNEGYTKGELKSLVYDDVPVFFRAACKSGARVAIYSSGSRQAQNLLFRYSNQGDMRDCISCYFDTTSGGKRESKSYVEIGLSLGVDDFSQILFVTDILEEAKAATQAGFRAVISERPGNAPLPENHGMRIIRSFDELNAFL